MCKNLVEKGALEKPLILYNRTIQRAEDLSHKIGRSTVARSIEDAVTKSDIIFICLGDDGAIKHTTDAILTNDVKGKLFVDCSTVHPETTVAEAKAYKEVGAHFVACPVLGAPAMAEAGQLVCVLAGPTEDVEKVKPFCKGVMGREDIDYSGEEPSKALLLKLVGNTLVLSMVEALSEGHTLAEKTGLGVENLHKFVETMFPGPYVAYSNRLRSGDYYKREEPLFAVGLALKDAGHAQSLAKSSGMEMKNVALAERYLSAVKDHMGSRCQKNGGRARVRELEADEE